MKVRCLCCGELYDIEGDCSYIDVTPHTVERAYEVACWLRDREIENPSSGDVAFALVALYGEAFDEPKR